MANIQGQIGDHTVFHVNIQLDTNFGKAVIKTAMTTSLDTSTSQEMVQQFHLLFHMKGSAFT
jgi:hypothetical protein